MINPKLKGESASASPNLRHSNGSESYISDGDCKRRNKSKRKSQNSSSMSGTKRRKTDVKVNDVCEIKEETNSTRVKWTFLEHKGPLFAPEYETLPTNVNFYYNGKAMQLSLGCQEVAGFYARMQGHEYTKQAVFNENFMRDWRTFMNETERTVIVDLSLCDFTEMCLYYREFAEARKGKSKEEKKMLSEERERVTLEYGFCTVDGHEQRIGNFKIEPPGLFRGRGDHPKMGCVKRRVYPEDVIINCSQNSRIPIAPTGHHWKEVRHDSSVCWLACWIDNVQQTFKYVLLNVSSKIRGERDWRKFEIARKLHPLIDGIRHDYLKDMQSKEMGVRQRAVALYFIDKLALRAGNEKGDDEADTVGCCSLRVEHVRLGDQRVGALTVYEIELDVLGKDSIRYRNCMPVLKRVYKNVAKFMEGKEPSDSLFDRLNASALKQHLEALMAGLTARVFRTYNASRTLEEQLALSPASADTVACKLLAYRRAHRAVAILCNHERSVPRGVERLGARVEAQKARIAAVKAEAREVKRRYHRGRDQAARGCYERLGETLLGLQAQLDGLERRVAHGGEGEGEGDGVGTGELSYLDPRISVSWCARNAVPLEGVYSRSQVQQFRWAVDLAGPSFRFCGPHSRTPSEHRDGDDDGDDGGP